MQRRRATTPARINANRRIACRHGFSIPVLAEPTLAPEVRATARAIERSLAGRALTELARLDRYERRALSRRNTAIYALAAAVRDCRVGKIALDHSSAWAT